MRDLLSIADKELLIDINDHLYKTACSGKHKRTEPLSDVLGRDGKNHSLLQGMGEMAKCYNENEMKEREPKRGTSILGEKTESGCTTDTLCSSIQTLCLKNTKEVE
ncbi:hypothetical protein D3C80_1453880 [compost metagenome]